VTVLPQPEAKGSPWNILASLGSGGDGTVNFNVFSYLMFFFGWLLVAYCPLTSERNYPASNIIRCNVNFLKFKCCTSFYLIFCSFYVRIFRTEKTGITILQLHSVLLACVCEDRRWSAKMQRGAVHWFVTFFSLLNIYCGLLLADKAMQLGMRCVFYLVSCS